MKVEGGWGSLLGSLAKPKRFTGQACPSAPETIVGGSIGTCLGPRLSRMTFGVQQGCL